MQAARSPLTSPWTRSTRGIAALSAAVLALALLAAVPQAAADPRSGTDPRWSGVAARPGSTAAAEQHADWVAAAGYPRPDLAAPGAVPGQLIVTTRGSADLHAMQRSGWQALDGVATFSATALGDRVALVATAPADAQAVTDALLVDPAVVAVEPDVRRQFTAVPDDTSYGLQWAHQQTNAETAWDTYTGQGGTAPLIAIIDSGVDASHPDLSGIVVSQLQARDGQVVPGAQVNDTCGFGHGTAVAGAAAARGDNGFGVTGALWAARIIDIAITDSATADCTGPRDSDTIAAISHVSSLPEPPLALNLSLGAVATDCPTGYQAAIHQARSAGIAVVAAAGNQQTSHPDSTAIPASCPGVISVAGTAPSGDRAVYSQVNPQVDIAGPGGDFTGSACPPGLDDLARQYVLTTAQEPANTELGGCPAYTDVRGQRLRAIAGTSFAAPYVAGAVGLLRQLASDDGAPLSVDQIEAVIEGTARDAGPTGRDCEHGWGILDLGAAVAAVRSGQLPALQPDAPIGSGSCDGGPAPDPGGCSAAPPAQDADDVIRFAADGLTTAVCQAVAISSVLPSGGAPYAVLARVDDFADALAGSAVGLGLGPLLYTSSTGPLDPATEAELRRVLDVGAADPPAVFIMGGTAAIPDTVDQRLRQLGMDPVRIAGAGREATAAAAAAQVEDLKSRTEFATRDHVFVAYGRNWPDAVAAGQMAAYYGIPVLVTNTEGLHEITRAELQRLQPSRVWVLGGTAVISDAVVDQIGALGLDVRRLAGPGRVDTALAVTDAYATELAADIRGGDEVPRPVMTALNMDDNFNDVLSASFIGGNGNLYLPLAGDGTILTDPVHRQVCGFGGPLYVVGGVDRISDETAGQVLQVLDSTSC